MFDVLYCHYQRYILAIKQEITDGVLMSGGSKKSGVHMSHGKEEKMDMRQIASCGA